MREPLLDFSDGRHREGEVPAERTHEPEEHGARLLVVQGGKVVGPDGAVAVGAGGVAPDVQRVANLDDEQPLQRDHAADPPPAGAASARRPRSGQ